MSIITRYYQQVKENKPPNITSADILSYQYQANTNHSSAIIVGNGFPNYSQVVTESLIWKLGNYAYTSPPNNALFGQLWYDTKNKKINVFVGPDFNANRESWFAIEKTDLGALPFDLKPGPEFPYIKYNLGSTSHEWQNIYVNEITASSKFHIGGVSISDLVPTSSSDITNTSTVPGSTVADALGYLKNLQIDVDPNKILNITQLNGDPRSITPTTNTRHRIFSNKDISITINAFPPGQGPSTFQILALGFGRITLSAGAGVIFNQNKNGQYASIITFISDDTLIDNEWRVFGNFEG